MMVAKQDMSALQSVFTTVQREYLVTRDQLQDEIFADSVNRSLEPEDFEVSYAGISTRSASLDELVEKGLISRVPTLSESTQDRIMDNLYSRLPNNTYMGVSKPRTIGFEPERNVVINDFALMDDDVPGRVTLGRCIPSVRWSDLDSIVEYLNIYKAVVTRKPDTKLHKPDMTMEQIEADIAAEEASPLYDAMVKKMLFRLMPDGHLDLDVARRLNDAGFPVAHVIALGKLTVMVSSEVTLNWDV